MVQTDGVCCGVLQGNKNDLPGALTTHQLIDKLGLKVRELAGVSEGL
jgi:hypothetical protein